METQKDYNYQRIAAAIRFITENFRSQPDLEEIARHVHVSPSHFQRMFTDWAGTSPKKFLQYISLQHAKQILDEEATIWDATVETGLSSTSRLHELFVKIEGMTPAEYRQGGAGLQINYDFAESPFGNLIVASTPKGICYMAFEVEEALCVENLRSKFPQAAFIRKQDQFQKNALQIFRQDWDSLPEIKLHLRGTDFQLKVWESLLRIPLGRMTTYGAIARQIGSPQASRAVGTAIGSNPVAYLIPCHRVIQSTGVVGGYMWGPVRKMAILGWESARTYGETEN